jgi:hypothetical protein
MVFYDVGKERLVKKIVYEKNLMPNSIPSYSKINKSQDGSSEVNI